MYTLPSESIILSGLSETSNSKDNSEAWLVYQLQPINKTKVRLVNYCIDNLLTSFQVFKKDLEKFEQCHKANSHEEQNMKPKPTTEAPKLKNKEKEVYLKTIGALTLILASKEPMTYKKGVESENINYQKLASKIQLQGLSEEYGFKDRALENRLKEAVNSLKQNK